ncbi:MAG: glycosyltransferase family 2 protein [Candidatus Saccharibacteria bacterium]|nr:glycosyltransferase family 2 protein [Candidatus Saccharibacteria bacterium]
MKQQSPLISIIIPVYNAESTIDKIIIKLLKQTYQNIELIIINDGSTDNSLQKIKLTVGDDQRAKIITQKNQGPSAARNFGLKKSTGDFVMFFDADDDFKHNIIKTMINKQQKNNSDMVVCGMKLNNKKIIPKQRVILKNNKIIRYVLRSLLKQNIFYGPYCKLFKRNIINQMKLKFDTKVKYGEDTIFVMNYITKINSLTMIDQALYQYNYSPRGTAFNNRKNQFYRNQRRNALNQMVTENQNLINWILKSLLLFRWQLSLIKARLK